MTAFPFIALSGVADRAGAAGRASIAGGAGALRMISPSMMRVPDNGVSEVADDARW